MTRLGDVVLMMASPSSRTFLDLNGTGRWDGGVTIFDAPALMEGMTCRATCPFPAAAMGRINHLTDGSAPFADSYGFVRLRGGWASDMADHIT